jgi:hypothetical protein
MRESARNSCCEPYAQVFGRRRDLVGPSAKKEVRLLNLTALKSQKVFFLGASWSTIYFTH